MKHALEEFGWNSWFEEKFAPFAALGLRPARVAVEHRSSYQLYTDTGPMSAVLAGKMRYSGGGRAEMPAVGDWVAAAVRPEGEATIHGVVPRKSRFARRAVQSNTAQIVAANIDIVFLMTSCNSDFQPRRLERYLALAWESGAAPVVVLSKADAVDDVAPLIAAAREAAHDAPVIAVSVVSGEGIDAIRALLEGRKTGALLGSSGVGKSSLVNALLGEHRLDTGAIRSYDDKGRHTTTRRELVPVPGGGLLIDTPGMREIQLFEGEAGVAATFEDIESLIGQCGFADCRHGPEPNCAVQLAVADGRLAPERFASWQKLSGEVAYAASKTDRQAKAEGRKQAKIGAKALRAVVKKKRG